jgi:BlaI family transcriptional regulator, penicillinase repressor
MKQVSLSDGEWKIMNLLWESSPYTIMQLVAKLKDDTGWSKHTIITMLVRLEAKKAVYYKEGERAKQYYPLIDKEATALQETNSFLEKVYAGSLELMLNTFVGKRNLSKEERQELYDILKKGEAQEK